MEAYERRQQQRLNIDSEPQARPEPAATTATSTNIPTLAPPQNEPDSGESERYGTTPLTAGQEIHVDHLLSVETDTLARGVLIRMKWEGLPSETYMGHFLSQFAEWGWDDESDVLAVGVLNTVRDSDWDERLAGADLPPVEMVVQENPSDSKDKRLTTVGLTDEQSLDSFRFDLEHEKSLKHNFSEESLSRWEDMWAADPREWVDYNIFVELSPIIKEEAARWNHPASGMSDFEVALWIIANLHQESRFVRTSSPAGFGLGWMKDKLGDIAMLFSSHLPFVDPSVGPANLRPSVVREMHR